MRDGYARASAFRRMFLNAKLDDPKRSSQFIPEIIRSSSSASMPVAKAPPIRPPMLVPAATSIGMRCSSNHRITPMWAMPRALPPPKATPIIGRASAGRAMGGRDSATGAGATGAF